MNDWGGGGSTSTLYSSFKKKFFNSILKRKGCIKNWGKCKFFSRVASPKLNILAPIKSFTLKETHIDSAVSRILRYKKKQTNSLLLYKDKITIFGLLIPKFILFLIQIYFEKYSFFSGYNVIVDVIARYLLVISDNHTNFLLLVISCSYNNFIVIR